MRLLTTGLEHKVHKNVKEIGPLILASPLSLADGYGEGLEIESYSHSCMILIIEIKMSVYFSTEDTRVQYIRSICHSV